MAANAALYTGKANPSTTVKTTNNATGHPSIRTHQKII